MQGFFAALRMTAETATPGRWWLRVGEQTTAKANAGVLRCAQDDSRDCNTRALVAEGRRTDNSKANAGFFAALRMTCVLADACKDKARFLRFATE